MDAIFVLPVLGPTNVRDTVGMIIDNSYLDPFATSHGMRKRIICVSGNNLTILESKLQMQLILEVLI